VTVSVKFGLLCSLDRSCVTVTMLNVTYNMPHVVLDVSAAEFNPTACDSSNEIRKNVLFRQNHIRGDVSVEKCQLAVTAN